MNKKIIIGIGIVLIITLIIIANLANVSTPTFSTGRVFEVKVNEVNKGEISSKVTASGVVEGIETAEVYFDNPMKVKQVLVEKNQKVAKGEKLVEFDIGFLYTELEQLKVNKQIQELTIEKLKTADSTRSVEVLKSAIELADKGVINAQRIFDEAVRNYEVNKTMFTSNVISKSELERFESLKIEAELALSNAEQNKKNAEENLREAIKSNSDAKAANNIDMKISKKNLESINLKIAEVEKKIKDTISTTLSPIDGVVTEVNLESGGFATVSMSGFSLINPDKLKIKADVKEFYVKDIKVGQDVLISGDAVSADDEVMGKVESISSIAKKKITSTGEETLIEVIIAIQKGSPILKPGLNVTNKIVTNVKKDVLLVSFDTLAEDKDGNKKVFVVDKDNIMHETPIKLGITSELDAEVVEGLNEGDRIVLYPKPNYTDGAKARLIKDN